MNWKSIATSWLIALCVLAIVAAVKQPTVSSEPENEAVITLGDSMRPKMATERFELEAKAWCALDSSQSLQFSFRGLVINARGAMAIAPHWNGGEFSAQQKTLIESCIKKRSLHLIAREDKNPMMTQRPAMEYLFSRL